MTNNNQTRVLLLDDIGRDARSLGRRYCSYRHMRSDPDFVIVQGNPQSGDTWPELCVDNQSLFEEDINAELTGRGIKDKKFVGRVIADLPGCFREVRELVGSASQIRNFGERLFGRGLYAKYYMGELTGVLYQIQKG